MTKRDVLVVSGIVFPEIGGVSNYVDFLTKHLQNIEVLSFNFYNTTRSEVRIENGKKYYLLRKVYFNSTKISYPIRILIMAYFIRKMSKNKIVYAQDVGISGLSCFLSFKRYLLRFVGDWAYESYYDKKIFSVPYEEFLYHTKHGIIRRLLSYLIFKRALMIITPAKHLKNTLIEYYKINPDKIRIIENFINLPESRITTRKKEKYLLFVGRIISLKRLDRLIKCYLNCLLNSDIKLYIVGDGYLREVYEKILSPYGDRILFLGKKNKKELRNLVANALCIVLPSNYEGIPFIVLESLKLGVPVIAYRNRGVEELARVIDSKDIYFFENERDFQRILKEIRTRKAKINKLDKLSKIFSARNHLNKLMEVFESLDAHKKDSLGR